MRRLPAQIRCAIIVSALLAIARAPAARADRVLEQGAALPSAQPALAITVVGDLAYIPAHARGVHIVDIGDTAAPRLLSTTPTLGAAYDVAVSDDGLLYVAAWSAGLEIFDVRDPAKPVRLGGAPTRANAHAVALLADRDDGPYVVTGDWAAAVFDAGDPEHGLLVFDASDPVSPVQVGRLDTPGWAGEIAVRGNRLYVADATGGVRIVDASDPRALREIGSAPTDVRAYGIDLDGEHQRALVADNEGGLIVLDIADPSNIRRLGAMTTGQAVYGVAWDAGLHAAWLATAAGGGPADPGSVVLAALDDSGVPSEQARLPTAQRAWGIAADGAGGAWVAATGLGLLGVRARADGTGEPTATGVATGQATGMATSPSTATATPTSTPTTGGSTATPSSTPTIRPSASPPATPIPGPEPLPVPIHLPLAMRGERPLAHPRPAPTRDATRPDPTPRIATATVTLAATPVVEESDALFARDALRDVRITLPADDWERLRHETRTMRDIFGAEECATAPVEHPYTWYTATVSVDGLRLSNVAVRKKGFLGSVVADKPSLKIKFDRDLPAQRMFGMRRMTLNNANVDPGLVRQCLVYDLFRAAGVVAPRCNFASVRVNGRSYGVYVHLESIKKPFLARHFSDDGGTLYEGTRADFRADWAVSFEQKTNAERDDRADIAALVAALDAPDVELMARLEPLVDLESFYRFWAMEALVGHWDAYANNRNNYYVYQDPESERFHFIPWGVDGSLRRHEISGQGSPASVSARAHLARRLYLHPQGRARYVATMELLLAEVWDEDALIASINRMAALVQSGVPAGQREAHSTDLVVLRTFVRARRARIVRELRRGGADWDDPPSIAPCRWSIGTLQATFAAVYGGASGRNISLTFTDLDGVETPLEDVGIAATDGAFRTWPRYPTLVINGAFSRDTEFFARGRRMQLFVFVARERFGPGSVALDGDTAFGWAYRQPSDPRWIFPALLWDGALTLDAASAVPGAPVNGTFTTDVWLWRKGLDET